MSTSHLSENLDLLHIETLRLIATAARLDDDDLRAPSLCEGWTRAHVLSHLARNADGLGNLVHWATTGEVRPMYPSPEARDADIQSGAHRGAAEIFTDLEDSAARFAAAAPGLIGTGEHAEVEARGGFRLRGDGIPTLRLREVVFHHVDLDAGYTFADADPGFVARSVQNAVERLNGGGRAPALTLRSDEGGVWAVGEGAAYGERDVPDVPEVTDVPDMTEVTGSEAALLLWLARGVGDRVTSSRGALPDLPPWG